MPVWSGPVMIDHSCCAVEKWCEFPSNEISFEPTNFFIGQILAPGKSRTISSLVRCYEGLQDAEGLGANHQQARQKLRFRTGGTERGCCRIKHQVGPPRSRPRVRNGGTSSNLQEGHPVASTKSLRENARVVNILGCAPADVILEGGSLGLSAQSDASSLTIHSICTCATPLVWPR